MWYVYIIYSKEIKKYYTGYTGDLTKRIEEHLSGKSSYSSQASDWELVYYETFPTKSEAILRERFIKRQKSVKFITNLVSAGGRPE